MKKTVKKKKVLKKKPSSKKKNLSTASKTKTKSDPAPEKRPVSREEGSFLRGAKRHFGTTDSEKPSFVSIPVEEEVVLRMFGKPIIRMLHWASIKNTKGQSYVVPLACSDYDYDITSWDGEKAQDECPLCKAEAGELEIDGVSFHPKFSDSTLIFRAVVLCIDRAVQKEHGTYDAIRIYCMSPMVYNRLIEFATPEEENAEFVSMKYRGDPLSTKKGYNVRIQNTGSSNTKEYYLINPSKKESPLTSEEIKEIKKWKEDHPEWDPGNYYKLRDESEILEFLEKSVEGSDSVEAGTYKKAAHVKKEEEEEFVTGLEEEDEKTDPEKSEVTEEGFEDEFI